MTTSSEPDAFAAFKEQHGLDADWRVRFTADAYRAREMAQQYRASGHDVRVLPLSPEGEELDPDALSQFEDAGHDPLQHVQAESCSGCLVGTHVVLTRESESASGDEGLVYE